MIAVAQILFNDSRSDQELLDFFLSDLSKSLPFPVRRTQWKGYTMVIPQVLVETKPVAMTLQVDRDESYVPDEIAELADDLQDRVSAPFLAGLRTCNTRLDIMSVSPPAVETTDEAITLFASSDLDPASPDVSLVLERLGEITRGFIVDNLEGRIKKAGDAAWIATIEE